MKRLKNKTLPLVGFEEADVYWIVGFRQGQSSMDFYFDEGALEKA